MEQLKIKGTEDSPNVIFSKEENKFCISGKSMPEDTKEFYLPIKEWLNNYFISPNDETCFEFEMIYFNTSSSKMILDIFYILKDAIDNNHNVKVKWDWQEDDEEMVEAGEDFAEIVEIPVDIKELSY